MNNPATKTPSTYESISRKVTSILRSGNFQRATWTRQSKLRPWSIVKTGGWDVLLDRTSDKPRIVVSTVGGYYSSDNETNQITTALRSVGLRVLLAQRNLIEIA
jgi:hypothetical protein